MSGRPSIENVKARREISILSQRSEWHFFRKQPVNGPTGYAHWLNALRSKNALPVEYLTDQIRIPYSDDLPVAMQKAGTRFESSLADEITGTHLDWGYYFYLGNNRSTLDSEPDDEKRKRSRLRTLHRLRMIGKSVSALFADNLSEKSCLDLACNSGAFSLEMTALGCRHVVGIDLRSKNIDRANLLKRYAGLENVEYRVEDVYGATGKFDIVLNLGLLYHVINPIALVQKTYDLCTGIAVIETVTHREPFSGFIMGNGSLISVSHAAGTARAELHPTYRALLDMMNMVGFKDLVEIEAEPDPMWHDFAKDPLGNKTRRAIVGFK